MSVHQANVIPAQNSVSDKRSILAKSLAAIYSLVAYLAFFGTILYAIGFIGNLIVPKAIDTGIAQTSLIAIVINSGLMALFALQHSLMARPFFKRWITRYIPAEIERSTYVLLSSLALAFVFWQWQPMTQLVWRVESLAGILFLTGLYFVGWVVVFLSSFMINHFELFGLKQVYDYCREQNSPETPFTVRYFYALVRHPLMLGFIIAGWAAPTMTVGHLLFSVIITLYILLAVKYLEERDLRRAIGDDYVAYQKKVPMLIPRIAGRR